MTQFKIIFSVLFGAAVAFVVPALIIAELVSRKMISDDFLSIIVITPFIGAGFGGWYAGRGIDRNINNRIIELGISNVDFKTAAGGGLFLIDNKEQRVAFITENSGRIYKYNEIKKIEWYYKDKVGRLTLELDDFETPVVNIGFSSQGALEIAYNKLRVALNAA